jgi:protocatechuate 3,4-dioxygenase beta subunit
LIAAGGATLASRLAWAQSSRAAPACIVRPEQTEGPFFVDERLHRSDIRSDPQSGEIKHGAPLRVTFRIGRMNAGACTPLAGVRVDLWHCDAAGFYSEVRDTRGSTMGQKFLRGYQLTDTSGAASFTTIYPGWYRGRAVHLHFKLRSPTGGRRSHEFTSQIYFDDALTDRVFAQAPYAARGPRDVRNHADGLFARGGRALLLPLVESADGYAGVFEIALDIA